MSRWNSRRRMRSGMTLVEIVVAISVLLVMAVATYEVLATTAEFNEALSSGDDASRSARVTMAKLRRELQLAFLAEHKNTQETYQTVFIGQDDNPDQLWFTSLSHQRVYANSRECDQTEITIFMEDPPRDRGPGEVLMHRESARIDEEAGEGGVVHPLAYNVSSFNLRYLDPKTNEWRDDWNSVDDPETMGRLPRAIEIGLVLLAPDPEDLDDTIEVPHVTQVILEYADRVKPASGNPDEGEINNVKNEENRRKAARDAGVDPMDRAGYSDGAGAAVNRVRNLNNQIRAGRRP
jgi:general secretion pathway protein J